MSKIEEIISEIEMYLDSCKPQAFSSNKKIVVEKDVIDEMLVELRMRTPEEIKRYQKIIASQDAIISNAEAQADQVIADAQAQAEAMVQEHEITQQAYKAAQEMMDEAQAQAQDIVDNAVNDANSIREGAMQYTDSALKNLQTILAHSMEDTQSRFDSFMDQMKSSYDVVTANRRELTGSAAMNADDDYRIDLSMSGEE